MFLVPDLSVNFGISSFRNFESI